MVLGTFSELSQLPAPLTSRTFHRPKQKPRPPQQALPPWLPRPWHPQTCSPSCSGFSSSAHTARVDGPSQRVGDSAPPLPPPSCSTGQPFLPFHCPLTSHCRHSVCTRSSADGHTWAASVANVGNIFVRRLFVEIRHTSQAHKSGRGRALRSRNEGIHGTVRNRSSPAPLAAAPRPPWHRPHRVSVDVTFSAEGWLLTQQAALPLRAVRAARGFRSLPVAAALRRPAAAFVSPPAADG